jgi:hypothetical protein
MRQAGLAPVRHRDAGARESLGVRVALVPQGVVLCGHDQRWRKVGHVGGVQRAHVAVAVPLELGHPLPRRPAHVVRVEAEAMCLLGQARVLPAQIGVRADQNLDGQRVDVSLIS